MDRPFAPNWADAEQAGLDRVRRDNAMSWLVDKGLLEREEEAENLLGTGEGLPDYDFGSAFRRSLPAKLLSETMLLLGGGNDIDLGDYIEVNYLSDWRVVSHTIHFRPEGSHILTVLVERPR